MVGWRKQKAGCCRSRWLIRHGEQSERRLAFLWYKFHLFIGPIFGVMKTTIFSLVAALRSLIFLHYRQRVMKETFSIKVLLAYKLVPPTQSHESCSRQLFNLTFLDDSKIWFELTVIEEIGVEHHIPLSRRFYIISNIFQYFCISPPRPIRPDRHSAPALAGQADPATSPIDFRNLELWRPTISVGALVSLVELRVDQAGRIWLDSKISLWLLFFLHPILFFLKSAGKKCIKINRPEINRVKITSK